MAMGWPGSSTWFHGSRDAPFSRSAKPCALNSPSRTMMREAVRSQRLVSAMVRKSAGKATPSGVGGSCGMPRASSSAAVTGAMPGAVIAKADQVEDMPASYRRRVGGRVITIPVPLNIRSRSPSP